MNLRWRLTLQYAAVTLVLMLVAEAIIVMVQEVMPILTDPPGSVVRVQQVVEQSGPLLENGTLDPAEVAAWLQHGIDRGFVFQNVVTDTGTRVAYSLTPYLLSDWRALVLDRQAQLLATAPQTSAVPQPGQAYDLQSQPGLAALWDRALVGETDPRRLYTRDTNRLMWIAAPIQNPAGEVQAVLLVTGTEMDLFQLLSWRTMIASLGNGLIWFTLVSTLIALVFGYLVARDLTRRLARLAQAAEGWSQGDFSHFVKDSSEDEIGQLGRRLNRMAEQLSNLMNTRRELASLQERNRLARDLHDSVKQQAFALSAQLSAAKALLAQNPERASQRLEEASRLSDQIREELTGLINELRPAPLAERGLAGSLKTLVEAWSRQSGITAEMQVGFSEADHLPEVVEQALYRVAQEALSNTSRHAQASQVWVRLAQEPIGLVLEIRDNGAGFAVAQVTSKGVGLSSMRERVESLGGEFQIESHPGSGTCITVRFTQNARG